MIISGHIDTRISLHTLCISVGYFREFTHKGLLFSIKTVEPVETVPCWKYDVNAGTLKFPELPRPALPMVGIFFLWSRENIRHWKNNKSKPKKKYWYNWKCFPIQIIEYLTTQWKLNCPFMKMQIWPCTALPMARIWTADLVFKRTVHEHYEKKEREKKKIKRRDMLTVRFCDKIKWKTAFLQITLASWGEREKKNIRIGTTV